MDHAAVSVQLLCFTICDLFFFSLESKLSKSAFPSLHLILLLCFRVVHGLHRSCQRHLTCTPSYTHPNSVASWFFLFLNYLIPFRIICGLKDFRIISLTVSQLKIQSIFKLNAFSSSLILWTLSFSLIEDFVPTSFCIKSSAVQTHLTRALCNKQSLFFILSGSWWKIRPKRQIRRAW